VKKPVGHDPEMNLTPDAPQAHLIHLAAAMPVVLRPQAKRVKIVNPYHFLRGLPYGINVQGPRKAPHIAALERRGADGNAVEIFPPQSTISGMEIRRHPLDPVDDHIVRQESIQCPVNVSQRHRAGSAEIGHLAPGMNAGIGPARTDNLNGLTKKLSETLR
jgi:hypothetical protein